MAEFEPLIHPETGEQVGWMTEADDGALIGLDLNGYITGALDPSTGALIDHEGYQPVEDYGEDYGYSEAEVPSDIAERMDALEQRAEQPQYVPYVAAEPGPDPEVMAADLVAQGAHLEARLGRPLTHAEHRAIGAELREQEIAGEQRLDVPGAVGRLHERGQGPVDIDAGSPAQRREARQQLMADLYRDHEREDAAQRGEDDLALPEPPGRGAYDVEDREQRTAYVMDRLRGQAEPADTFSGSDYPDSGGETYDPDAA